MLNHGAQIKDTVYIWYRHNNMAELNIFSIV